VRETRGLVGVGHAAGGAAPTEVDSWETSERLGDW